MKKFLAFSLVVGSLVFFIVTIAPRKSVPNKNAVLFETQKGNDTNLSFNASQNKSIGNASGGSGSLLRPSDNLTEYVASLYAHALVKENGIQSSIYDIGSLPPLDEISADSLARSALGSGLTFQSFTVRDIRTIDDKSKSAESAYFQKLGNSIEKKFGSINMNIVTMLSAFIEKNNPEPLRAYTSAIKPHMSELLAIEVPTQLSLVHIQLLNLWEKKFTVVSAILQSDTDPLRAYLALGKFDEIQREDETLKSRLTSFIDGPTQ